MHRNIEWFLGLGCLVLALGTGCSSPNEPTTSSSGASGASKSKSETEGPTRVSEPGSGSGGGATNGAQAPTCQRDLKPVAGSFSPKLAACLNARCCNEAGACAVNLACQELDKCIDKCGPLKNASDRCWANCRAPYPETTSREQAEFVQCKNSCTINP
jgi:hypothetical protein